MLNNVYKMVAALEPGTDEPRKSWKYTKWVGGYYGIYSIEQGECMILKCVVDPDGHSIRNQEFEGESVCTSPVVSYEVDTNLDSITVTTLNTKYVFERVNDFSFGEFDSGE